MILETVHAANSPLNELLKSDAMKNALLRAAAKMQTQTPALEPVSVPEPSPAPKDVAPAEEAQDDAQDEEDNFHPPNRNPAIARCIRAFNRALNADLKAGKHSSTAYNSARYAYRNTIPPLAGRESVSDFIACVTHGMLIGSIPMEDASRYIYAAQVAQTTSLEPPSRSSGRPAGRPPYPPRPYPEKPEAPTTGNPSVNQ